MSPTLADPWKGESGKSRRGGDDRRYERSYGYYDLGGDYGHRYGSYEREYKQEYYRGPLQD